MANDFFERVLNPTWKNLSRESKEVVIRNILRFFVNPILTIEDLKFVQLMVEFLFLYLVRKRLFLGGIVVC